MQTRLTIKICGNHSESDALMTAAFGPDMMGWIFSWKSPRRAHPETAAAIIRIISGFAPEIRHVGVFAGNSVGEILNVIRRCPALDFLQIVEGGGFIQALALHIPSAPMIPVIRPDRPIVDADLERYPPAPFFIVDAFDRDLPGGTGKRVRPELVEHITLPFLLAGGLHADNVIEAARAVPCAGVDVSSGVEVRPGKKDTQKVRDFIAAARSVKLE